MDKAAYVAAQGQSRDHSCHWPGCPQQVPPAQWGCKKHWLQLPWQLRKAIWAAFRPGQEIDGKPSAEYLAAAAAVQDWIREQPAPKAKTKDQQQTLFPETP